jgi:hypothetical protein
MLLFLWDLTLYLNRENHYWMDISSYLVMALPNYLHWLPPLIRTRAAKFVFVHAVGGPRHQLPGTEFYNQLGLHGNRNFFRIGQTPDDAFGDIPLADRQEAGHIAAPFGQAGTDQIKAMIVANTLVPQCPRR